jgi:hypothetical protein
MTPNATHSFDWEGYEHLPVDDRPHSGVNGLDDCQRLWLNFYLERVIRNIYQHQLERAHGHVMDAFFARLESLPTNR